MEPVTRRQQQVLDYVSDHLQQQGYPPTLREIAAHLNVSGTLGVLKHLQALEKKGFIEKEAGSSRGIRIVGQKGNGLALPIAGRIAAGALQPAVEEIDGYFTVDRTGGRSGDFLLQVKGDSMIEAGILNGDLVQIRPQQTASDGDIIAVLVDDEATLKRFYRGNGHIRLQPENTTMQPIIVTPGDGETRIVGKLVGLFRQF
ncbi:MAG: LexA family transcriptional regulator [Desulfuromonas sp.]|nr:MAG: LexA family transcriptional regulator [Desulfuromonas sp.]